MTNPLTPKQADTTTAETEAPAAGFRDRVPAATTSPPRRASAEDSTAIRKGEGQ